MFGDLFRYTIAATIVIALGLTLGFRPDGGVLGVLGGLAPALVFAYQPLVDLDDLRTEDAHARVGHADEHDDHVPAGVRHQHLRPP